jgi:translation initiation factor 1
MPRGQKLDLFIGAQIDDDWAQVEERKSKVASKDQEPSKHQLFFSKEKRRGKVVTLVGEFYMPKSQTSDLLKKIKKSLGCGGSYKDSFMEFQGDIKEKIRPLLVEAGFNFKPKH